jgi:hypothetical protein
MPDMFSPCFDLDKTKNHPFNHLPLRSNPYMTPDTTVCREEWARLLEEIKKARDAARDAEKEVEERPEATEAEKEAAYDKSDKMMWLKIWAEGELAAVNAYCDWVDMSDKFPLCFSDAEYLAAIYNLKAFHRIHRVAHWKSLVS